jgi:hypothetical protein
MVINLPATGFPANPLARRAGDTRDLSRYGPVRRKNTLAGSPLCGCVKIANAAALAVARPTQSPKNSNGYCFGRHHQAPLTAS